MNSCIKKLICFDEMPYLDQNQNKIKWSENKFPLYTGQKVRSIVHCFRCQKPRCIYSPRQLSGLERQSLEELEENSVFSCDTALVPPTHPLQGKVFQMKLNCHDAIEGAYYTTVLQLPTVCYNCGKEISEPDERTSELLLKFRLVFPSCIACRTAEVYSKGLFPIQAQGI